MATVKWELEDLSFAILHPKKYDEIVRLVADRAPSRDTYLAKVRAEINSTLSASRINAIVEGRPKHYWSIYQKMIVKGRDFDDIHDLVGVRILCEEVRDCYAAVGVVHSLWQPMAGRFKDYIAQPRYRRLPVAAHHRRGTGTASPWRSRSGPQDMHRDRRVRYRPRTGGTRRPRASTRATSPRSTTMAWMRQLLDWQREAADPGEFLESLRYDLAVKEIFVFTPKGDVITLPAGIDSRRFRVCGAHRGRAPMHRCQESTGRLVALERTLENGEVVEVFTSKAATAGPSRDWQTFVVSPRAKAKIRQWFAKERREEALESGKDQIAKEVRRVGLPLRAVDECRIDEHDRARTSLSRRLGVVHGRRRESGVGAPRRAATGCSSGRRRAPSRRNWPSVRRRRPCRCAPASTGDSGILVPGAAGHGWQNSRSCCTPVPGRFDSGLRHAVA